MGKIVGVLFALLLFVLLFFPRVFPRLLRKLGHTLRNVGRAGQEIASGEEPEGSPLARYEVQAGEMVLLKVRATVQPTEDSVLQDEITAIGNRVAAGARRREIPYRFTVIEEGEPNAFAVPGGAIFISRSLIELSERNPDCVATVLGHEIAHIDLRHAIFNLAARAAARTGAALLSKGRLAILRQLSSGIEELLVKGYHQDQEFEADRLGASLARSAGYDPRGLIRLLRVLARKDPEARTVLAEIHEYFRSHPPAAERAARLERLYGR